MHGFFFSGKPADALDTNNPDWAPTQHLPTGNSTTSAVPPHYHQDAPPGTIIIKPELPSSHTDELIQHPVPQVSEQLGNCAPSASESHQELQSSDPAPDIQHSTLGQSDTGSEANMEGLEYDWNSSRETSTEQDANLIVKIEPDDTDTL